MSNKQNDIIEENRKEQEECFCGKCINCKDYDFKKEEDSENWNIFMGQD